MFKFIVPNTYLHTYILLQCTMYSMVIYRIDGNKKCYLFDTYIRFMITILKTIFYTPQ